MLKSFPFSDFLPFIVYLVEFKNFPQEIVLKEENIARGFNFTCLETHIISSVLKL